LGSCLDVCCSEFECEQLTIGGGSALALGTRTFKIFRKVLRCHAGLSGRALSREERVLCNGHASALVELLQRYWVHGRVLAFSA